MICQSNIINANKNILFDFFLNFNNISLLFNHISAISDYNALENHKIGKKYKEETKNFLGFKRFVIVELYGLDKPNYLLYRTNHWLSKHEVRVDFKSISTSKTEVTISFILNRNSWLRHITFFKKIFQNRTSRALIELKKIYK